jgi:hypothetical protein
MDELSISISSRVGRSDAQATESELNFHRTGPGVDADG